MKIVFPDSAPFAALKAAEFWCHNNGIAFGSLQGDAPRGLHRGQAVIAKWHTLTAAEIAALDGRMTGDMRNGPVTIDLLDAPTTL